MEVIAAIAVIVVKAEAVTVINSPRSVSPQQQDLASRRDGFGNKSLTPDTVNPNLARETTYG